MALFNRLNTLLVIAVMFAAVCSIGCGLLEYRDTDTYKKDARDVSLVHNDHLQQELQLKSCRKSWLAYVHNQSER